MFEQVILIYPGLGLQYSHQIKLLIIEHYYLQFVYI
jgi:hypothetical protein